MIASSPIPPLPECDFFDVLGCGFGPSNLAIAIALVEKSESLPERSRRIIFVEKHPEFLWHPGMLIPGARMQISCLKDLATLRNPTSAFTFIAYLHSQSRLSTFINRGSTIPSRREFADYLSWAAQQVVQKGIDVVYAEELVSLSKGRHNGIECIHATSRRVHTGELIMRRTKHLILSAGGSPWFPRALSSLQPVSRIPEIVQDIPVIHTSAYLTEICPILSKLARKNASTRIAVIGAGQSAAECLLDIHRRLETLDTTGHKIDMIIRKGSLKSSSEGPFANESFDPIATDTWYNLPSDRARNDLFLEYKGSNYGAVNPVTLESIYELMYEQKLSASIAARKSLDASSVHKPGVQVSLRAYQNVVGARILSPPMPDASQQIVLTMQDTISKELSEGIYDAVICGTGYDRNTWLRLLRDSNLAKDFGVSSADYSAQLVPERHQLDNASEPIEVTGEQDYSSTDSSASSICSPVSPIDLSFPTLTIPKICISRTYRLLPSNGASATSADSCKIYLQGVAEATHGLSDTLLSVLGVRAGEVANDLW